MNRAVQILLLIAVLIPLAGMAREETMQERKRRITRKYMAEKAEVTQSDMLVPEDVLPEDDQLADSERFMEPEVDIARQEGGAPMMPPPPRRKAARPANRNWLLAVEPLEEDLDTEAPERAEDYWKAWGQTEERSSTYGDSRTGSRYGQQQDPAGYDARRQGMYNPRNPETQQSGMAGQQGTGRQSGMFGQQEPEQSTVGGYRISQPATYGSSPQTGLLQSPFSRQETEQGRLNRSDLGRQQYPPSQSPYQTRRETPTSRQWGNTTPKPAEEYQRTDPYKKWKETNNQWDPTADDAFSKDIMSPDRR